MLTYMISKLMGLVCGLLYPAYSSFVVVKNKDVRGYVQWMMYWIVFALYSSAEALTDTLLGPWFPFYYEAKIAFILWLVAPQTAGAGFLYRRFIHPRLVKHQPEIEFCIENVQRQTSSLVFQWANRLFHTAIQVVTETMRRGAIRAANYEFLNRNNQITRTWSLNDLDEGDGRISLISSPGSYIYSRSSVSVGNTPSEEVDLSTFYTERMREDMQLGNPSQRNMGYVQEEEEVVSDGEVRIVEVQTEEPEPQKRGPRTRRRRKKEPEIYKHRRTLPPYRYPIRPQVTAPPPFHSNVALTFPPSDPPVWTDNEQFYDARDELTDENPFNKNSSTAVKVFVTSKTLLKAFDEASLSEKGSVSPEKKHRKKALPNAYRVLTGDALNLASCITPNLVAATAGKGEYDQGRQASWRRSDSKLETVKRNPFFSSHSFRRVFRTFSAKEEEASEMGVSENETQNSRPKRRNLKASRTRPRAAASKDQ